MIATHVLVVAGAVIGYPVVTGCGNDGYPLTTLDMSERGERVGGGGERVDMNGRGEERDRYECEGSRVDMSGEVVLRPRWLPPDNL